MLDESNDREATKRVLNLNLHSSRNKTKVSRIEAVASSNQGSIVVILRCRKGALTLHPSRDSGPNGEGKKGRGANIVPGPVAILNLED